MPALTPTKIDRADDRTLLDSYVSEQSQEAFTELVRRHLDLVYATALRRVGGDQHLAEEVAQSVFTDCARKASALRQHAVLAGWLYRSTRFAAAQAVRTEQRRRNHEQEAHTLNELDSAGTIHWQKIRPILDEAMDDLSDDDREAVLLRFFENLPLAEVGTKLSINSDAARMRVNRALDKLGGLLAKRGIVSTTAALTAAFASQSGFAAPVGLSAKIVSGVFGVVGTATGVGIGLAKTSLGVSKVLIGCAAAGLIGVGIVTFEKLKMPPIPVTSHEEVPNTRTALTTHAVIPPTNGPSIRSSSVAPTSPAKISGPRRVGLINSTAIKRLDALVGLTAEQKVTATEIFGDENEALRGITSSEERMNQGEAIRKNARAQIRTILTPAQQEIYDATPQRFGGGSLHDPTERTDQVDRVVTLTEAQTIKVVELYQNEYAALEKLPPEQLQGPEGTSIRQATKEQVRALLTPDQRQKLDANPTGARDLETRIYVDGFIKIAPAVLARLGEITQVKATRRKVSTMLSHEHLVSMKGQYYYDIQGRSRSDTFTVYWEKASPAAPTKIIRIEGSDGNEILPK